MIYILAVVVTVILCYVIIDISIQAWLHHRQQKAIKELEKQLKKLKEVKIK